MFTQNFIKLSAAVGSRVIVVTENKNPDENNAVRRYRAHSKKFVKHQTLSEASSPPLNEVHERCKLVHCIGRTRRDAQNCTMDRFAPGRPADKAKSLDHSIASSDRMKGHNSLDTTNLDGRPIRPQAWQFYVQLFSLLAVLTIIIVCNFRWSTGACSTVCSVPRVYFNVDGTRLATKSVITNFCPHLRQLDFRPTLFYVEIPWILCLLKCTIWLISTFQPSSTTYKAVNKNRLF